MKSFELYLRGILFKIGVNWIRSKHGILMKRKLSSSKNSSPKKVNEQKEKIILLFFENLNMLSAFSTTINLSTTILNKENFLKRIMRTNRANIPRLIEMLMYLASCLEWLIISTRSGWPNILVSLFPPIIGWYPRSFCKSKMLF